MSERLTSCIICGREFRPRDADTAFCPACGGPPEALARDQPVGTVLVSQASGPGAIAAIPSAGAETETHRCLICGREFRPRDANTAFCPACGGPPEAPMPDQPVGTVLTSAPKAMEFVTPSEPQGTVGLGESSVSTRAFAAETDVPSEWKEGDVILDLYEVKGTLGRGGMGAVYRVHHKKWNLDLAVKTPLPAALQKAGGKEAFVEEATAWVKLGLHPHIVTCYYVRDLGGVPRVFAECVEGGSLKDWIRDRRLYAGDEREAMRRILDLAVQFAWGLGYAHAQGMVHQDVKPENALMTPDGTLKVTDFGLVKSKGYSPAYAAPEQILGKEVDARTDIWCWGVSVLEMFTGGVTWLEGSIALSVLENYLDNSPSDLPRMPQGVAELLRECFQDDPNLRPPNMDVVAERLLAVYQQEFGEPYPREQPNPLDLRADSLNNYAVSMLDLGREEEAVRLWQEALQADPAHLEANFNYGYYRWHKAELLGSEFLKQMQQLESTHGSNPEYWRLLGWVYLEQGYVDEVEEILQKRGVQDNVLRRAYDDPNRPIGRIVRQFSGHTDFVNSVTFLPNGRYVFTGSADKTARLWDVETGKEVRRFLGHTSGIISISLSSDGRYALTAGGDKTVRLWDIETGREIRVFRGHRDQVHSVAFSPDGLYALSGSLDHTVRLWETKTGRELRRFQHKGEVYSVAFSPVGSYILSGGSDGLVCIWDVVTGRLLRGLIGHNGALVTCTFSPEGDYILSGGADGTIRLWSTSTGQQLLCFRGHAGPVKSVIFSPSQQNIVSCGLDNTVRLWNLKGHEIRCFEEHSQWVLSVAFSPDNRYILSGSADKSVILRRVYFSNVFISPWPLLSHTKNFIQLSKTKSHFAALIRKFNHLMDKGSVRDAYLVLRQAQDIPDYQRDSSVQTLLSRCGQKGQRTKLRDVWVLYCFSGHTDSVSSVAFSPCGQYVCSGSWDGTTRVWSLVDRKELLRFKHTDKILSVGFSPDGRYILSGSEDGTLLLLDLKAEREKWRLKKRSISAVAFSPDGQYALAAERDARIIHLYEVETGRQVINFMTYNDKLFSATFSPDARFIISGGGVINVLMQVWEIATINERSFRGHFMPIASVKFAPDQRYALSGGYDVGALLWDLKTGEVVHSFTWPEDELTPILPAILCADFTPDGKYILGGALNSKLVVWSASDGVVCKIIKGHLGCVNSVVLSQDGHQALSGSGDKTIRLWQLDWDYDFPDPADWDEGARPYLDIFLTLHTPYGPDGLSRVGAPQWTEEDFQKLLTELGYRGYGWLRPEGVRRELEKMARERGWKGG